MKKIGNLLVLLLVIMGTSCDDPYANDTYVLYDTQPASTYLSNRADEFSEWIEVMKYADLYNAVNQATKYFTLFVPTNEAMQEFYQKKGVASIQDLGEEYAINMVKYHLIQDTIDQATFISTEGALDKKTVSDDYLSVSIKEGEGEAGGINSIYINDEAHVIEFANKVSNGYIYVLENALTPLTESLYERFAEHADMYGIFNEALDQTGWGEKINVIYADVTNENGQVVQEKRNFTVLAVTDAVYQQCGIDSFADLAQKLESGSDYTAETNALYNYVGYHIISGAYDLKKMQTFDTDDATSKLWNTMSGDGIIRVSDFEGRFWLNYNDENSRCNFIEDACDLQAKNGYIHQLSGWMPIAEPEPETVLFDLTNFDVMKEYSEKYGQDGQMYQTVGESEYNCELEGRNPTCYEFKVNNAATGQQYHVNYFTAKSGNDWKNANLGDFLFLNLGYNGWISMQTPSIMKGRYKVTIGMGYATSMDFIRTATKGSNGGELILTFDGQHQASVKPFMDIPDNTLGCYTSVIYGTDKEPEVEFDATGPHTFKIVFNDPAASGKENYRLMLDYLLFEPVLAN